MESATTSVRKELTRKQSYSIMHLLENLPYLEVSSESEDITQQLFEASSKLEDLEMITKPGETDFEETLTSIELLDKKMDQKFFKDDFIKNNSHTFKMLSEGELSFEKLSEGQKLALLRELILQFAVWQDQIAHLQQSVYSGLYMKEKRFY